MAMKLANLIEVRDPGGRRCMATPEMPYDVTSEHGTATP